MLVADDLMPCLCQQRELINLCLDVCHRLVPFDAHHSLLDARQLILHHLIGHLGECVGIAQGEVHGLSFLDAERVALMQFLEWSLDECQGGAYVVCGIDEEVDLLVRHLHLVSRLEVFTYQVQDDADDSQFEQESTE